jgi:hypothetical protein
LFGIDSVAATERDTAAGRPDLSPKKTSQITSIFGRDVAIGDKQVLPTIVVDIGKDTAPRPTPHLNFGFIADFRELAITQIAKQ